ncbi:potassium/sodium hyperpolarization-activated cyclic nucleotide-gated channel 1-like [Ostrinia nubilalis]|uniref:potassium/sodium hyperpolarization-activated cyclic nucleotide-gated channel 1-like n=1 Tax=Ostrinia nubilalis TaxID=29057 RepID=UPI0030826916
MYSHGDFHESYYEHGCSIIHEKDVLETDIKGTTWLVNFKRRWYNLFLLSSSDKRARIYYNSSHAMKVERARHFRRHRNCIHPLSKFRIFWDLFILIVMLLYKIIFHHNSSLVAGDLPLAAYFLGVFIECILFFDVYINTKCGYIDESTRKIVLDSQKAFQHYCSTKLFLHVASAIPLHSIMFLRYGMNMQCAKCKSNRFHCTVTLISVFSLLRVYEVTSYWTKERDSFKATCFFRFLRIGVLGMITMLEFITLSDTITLLAFINTGKLEPQSYYCLVLYLKLNGKMSSNLSLFTYDFSRIFKSLLLFNFGFVFKIYYLNMLSSLLAYAIANVFYMWGVIEVFSCVSRGKFPQDQMIYNRSATIRLARCRQLPDKICLKLQQYYDFNMMSTKILEGQNGLYKSLPAILKKEIILHCYSRMVMRIPYFSEWPMKIIEGLVFILKEETFLKHDIVADSGVRGDGLLIVDVGVMAVYSSDHREMGHLIDGDYFGELSLVTDKEIRTSYVVAVTSCKVLILEKGVFRKFMRDHPELFFKMKQRLRSKYSLAGAPSNESED